MGGGRGATTGSPIQTEGLGGWLGRERKGRGEGLFDCERMAGWVESGSDGRRVVWLGADGRFC